MTIGILACPIDECESTKLAVVIRAKMKAQAERERKLREAKMLAEKRRREEFARLYLVPKQPIQPRSHVSLLTEGIQRGYWLHEPDETLTCPGTPQSVAALSFSDDEFSCTLSPPRTYVEEAFLSYRMNSVKGMGKESYF